MIYNVFFGAAALDLCGTDALDGEPITFPGYNVAEHEVWLTYV
jgi:hypothetical protein